MPAPQLFLPHALAQVVPVREGRIVRDMTMPERDWSVYDTPANQRRALDEAKWSKAVARAHR